MNKFRLSELINIYLTYKTIKHMSHHRDMRFVDALREVRRMEGESDEKVSQTAYFCFLDSTKAMMHELLVLLKDAHFEDINFSHPDIQKLIKKIKAKMPTELKTLNGEQLVKAIRDMIAHNCDEKINYNEYFIDKFELSFKVKGTATPVVVKLDADDLVDILFIIDRCKDKSLEAALEVNNTYTMNTLLKARNRVLSYNEILSIKDKNGNPITFDGYQDRALTRFLMKNTDTIVKLERIHKSDKYFHLLRYAPFASNKINNYEHKSFNMLMLVDCIKDGQMNYEEITEYMTNNFIHGAYPLYDRETLDSLWFSTIAFNLVSMMSAEELEQLAGKTKYPLSSEQCRHMRNALIHGRYFYNYNNGYELYDGKDGNLEHCMTLNVNTIFHLFKASVKNLKEDFINSGYNPDSEQENI